MSARGLGRESKPRGLFVTILGGIFVFVARIVYLEPRVLGEFVGQDGVVDGVDNLSASTRFVPMTMNNHSDALCVAEKRSSDNHVENMGKMFAFLESYERPYWHNRGLARIASRFGAGLIEVKPGFITGPDHDFDLMMLVGNESHWNATIHHMKEHCPPRLFCVIQVQWNIPRLYIWKIGLPVKYANIMPVYHRNATHGQLHPFHRRKVGTWKLLDDIFPLKRAKLWMYELPVAQETWKDCQDGLNVTRIYATHKLNTMEERRRARQLMYGCAKNLSAKGYASYYHCFDQHGFYNGSSWML